MIRKEDLQSEMKEALRSGDKTRLDTIRLLLSAIKLVEVEKQELLDESALLSVIQKEVKMRHESISDARKAGREDLIHELEKELQILQEYLPEPLNEEDLKGLAQDAILETGAQTPQDMGKVMNALMPRVQGRADGKTVSQIVRTLLLKE
jgi:uncharacterized protein YqeY